LDTDEIAAELRKNDSPQKVTIDYELDEKLEPAEDIKKKLNSTQVDPFNRASPQNYSIKSKLYLHVTK